VLGASVALLDMGETLAAVEQLVDSGGQHLIATVDSSGLVIAQDDSELANIYEGASLCTADS
jgi:UDP-N-acetyl-D-mannosaminuronic acid transferase (WecB/TagA/CpsF family)